MKIIKLKSNKGISLTDVAIAIILIAMLGGLIANMFSQLYFNIVMLRMNAKATAYCVNILEDTDKLSYDDVNEQNDVKLKEKYNLPNNFKAFLSIENYNNNNEKEDLLKIVNLKIEYTYNKHTEILNIKKLKVREI